MLNQRPWWVYSSRTSTVSHGIYILRWDTMLFVKWCKFWRWSQSFNMIHMIYRRGHYLMLMHCTLIVMMLCCSNVMSSSISCHLLLVLACFTRWLTVFTRVVWLLWRILMIKLLMNLIELLITKVWVYISLFIFARCHLLIKKLMKLFLFSLLQLCLFSIRVFHHQINFVLNI